MASLKDDIRDIIRDIIGDLSRLLAEDETPAGTSIRSEHVVALTPVLFGVETLLRGDLGAKQAWLEEGRPIGSARRPGGACRRAA
jgi:hypothetical protein